LEIYNKNKVNYKVLSKYISDDNIINYINEYINYSLKEINAAIIIQKKFKKSIIYKNYKSVELLTDRFMRDNVELLAHLLTRTFNRLSSDY